MGLREGIDWAPAQKRMGLREGIDWAPAQKRMGLREGIDWAPAQKRKNPPIFSGVLVVYFSRYIWRRQLPRLTSSIYVPFLKQQSNISV